MQFEADNRLIRSLRPLQAFAVQLNIGLWSGDKRKMEIAESFVLPLITVSQIETMPGSCSLMRADAATERSISSAH